MAEEAGSMAKRKSRVNGKRTRTQAQCPDHKSRDDNIPSVRVCGRVAHTMPHNIVYYLLAHTVIKLNFHFSPPPLGLSLCASPYDWYTIIICISSHTFYFENILTESNTIPIIWLCDVWCVQNVIHCCCTHRISVWMWNVSLFFGSMWFS